MKASTTLTKHAEKRVKERCSLSSVEIKRLLDAQAFVLVKLEEGELVTQRLIYSKPDTDWFVVIQDHDTGSVVTIMPLSYVEWRTEVTGLQKRQARRKALDELDKVEIDPGMIPPPPGWNITVVNSTGKARSLGFRTPEELGNPDSWKEPGLIHEWFRAQIDALGIPIESIKQVRARHGKKTFSVRFLLEFVPMTEAEIAACKPVKQAPTTRLKLALWDDLCFSRIQYPVHVAFYPFKRPYPWKSSIQSLELDPLPDWSWRVNEAQSQLGFYIKGKLYPRTRYGQEKRPWLPPTPWKTKDKPCHDCSVLPGQLHVPGCDYEECPRCRGQCIGCSCW